MLNRRIFRSRQFRLLSSYNRYLLTVTDRDTVLGSVPDEQASIWQERSQSALQQAQSERTTAYLRQASLLAVGIVLVSAGLTWLLGWIKHHSFVAASQRLSPTASASSDFEPLRALEFLLRLVLALARTGLWIGATLYITNLLRCNRSDRNSRKVWSNLCW